MKKLLYTLFILSTFVFAQSCSNEEDTIFDTSAADRMSNALKEYQDVLVGAKNGWLMEYYAEEEPTKIGGYTYFCSFDAKGKVTMATEVVTTQNPKTKVSSTYDLISNAGPVLTFNTYNELFHVFSEPKGSGDTDGDAGDYEFVLMEVSAEKIVMKGKKRGNRITMTPVKETVSWDDYIDEVIKMAEENYYPGYKVIINGTEVASAGNSYITRLFTFTDNNGVEIDMQNAIYTPTGFKFYDPVSINGVVMQNFVWDNAADVYKCSDAGVNVVFEGKYPAYYIPYATYVGQYTFTHTDGNDNSHTVNTDLVEDVKNKTFLLQGAGDFDFIVNYDRESSHIYVTAHAIGKMGNYDIVVSNWLGGTFFNDNVALKYVGDYDASSLQPVITFKSNNPGSGHVGFMVLAWLGSTPYLYNWEHFYSNVVMTKQ